MQFPPVLECRVSTHSRLKAAGQGVQRIFPDGNVSTHSRLKAAGADVIADGHSANSFNTQPPEGGWRYHTNMV